MLKQTIDSDIKQGLLAGDKPLVETLRMLKSSILYAEVASGKKEQGLNDDEICEVLKKESKKRREAADLYAQANEKSREETELYQKTLIDKYLPEQMSEEDIDKVVLDVISNSGPNLTMQDMGKIIGLVRSKIGNQADGSLIAASVKKHISGND